jgi:putative ABC transport system ATP-binding protein
MTIVSTTSVKKQFEEGRDAVPVLHGIDFNVDRGEIVSLEGPSGSGKTTFLSILGAILTPTAGEVIINGERIDGASESRLAAIRRKHLGFVFQQFNLFPSLTALENVEYALNVKGTKGNSARVEAERVIEAVGLSDRKNYLPRDLSGGQKQRVAIARALAGSAPVLLADEPTANLDSVVGTQVLEMFRALAKRENRALVIVTHDPKVRSIADRVVSIRDGRIAA